MRGLLIPVFPGPGLAANLGAPIALLLKLAGVADALLFGVKFGPLLIGDSGLGRDGRPCALKTGLGARAPGPTD